MKASNSNTEQEIYVNSPRRPKIYIAGPLFSQAELTFNETLAYRLENEVAVYLPQRDGGKLSALLADGMNRKEAYKTIFEKDLKALKYECCAVLVVLDGRTVDEGACFELGFAYATGQPCVGLQTDTRRLVPSGNNPMIEMPLMRIYRNIESVVRWARALNACHVDLMKQLANSVERKS